MNTRGRRRWVLPVYLALLAVWSLAVVVSFAAFGGPTGPVAWLQIGVTYLVLGLAGQSPTGPRAAAQRL